MLRISLMWRVNTLSKVSDAVVQLETTAEAYLRQVEKAFQLMNQYASGAHMKQWSCVDPQAVLGEVYGILAVGFTEFRDAVDTKAINDE